MAKIAVHGFLNADLMGKVNSFADPDQEVELKDFQLFSGGSAANVAVGLSRLGQEVYFLGAVGEDQYAQMLVDSLENVRRDYLQQISNDTSGTVMVIVDQQGLRTMYTYPGANRKFDLQQVPEQFFNSLNYLHLSSPALNLVDQFYQLKSHQEHLQISLDPSALMTTKGWSFLLPYLSQTDILFLNESELMDLFPHQEMDQAIEELHLVGPQDVFIKLGERGAIYSSISHGVAQQISQPALNVKAVDSTGSGDAFAAGVLYGLSQGWPPASVLKAGIELGACVVSHLGAKTGLPYALNKS